MQENTVPTPEIQDVGKSEPLSFIPKKSFLSIPIIIGVLCIVLLEIIGGYWWLTKKHELPIKRRLPIGSISPSVSPPKQAVLSDFFNFSIPKPLENLTIYDLPNYGSIGGSVIENSEHLWFVGDGSLIEYDKKNSSIVSYSKLSKGSCAGSIVMVSNFLFTSCRVKNVAEFSSNYEGISAHESQYAVFKINPLTHVVEHVFTPQDGLLNTSNYQLYADGDTVWVTTQSGVGRINIKTNQVEFYTKELGVPGTTLSVSNMLVDTDYVWVSIGANIDSPGGLSLYDKKTQKWKSFIARDVKDYEFSHFDLEEGFKSVLGGVQIAFRDGQLNGKQRLVEKQYTYQTGKWIKVNSDRIITGDEYEKTKQYLNATYPQSIEYEKIDQFGLTQLLLPSSVRPIPLEGRNSYIISPMVGNKRYVLTGATVDIIDDTSPFARIFVKLGERLIDEISLDPVAFGGYVQFLVDPDSLLAVVTDSACGGEFCTGDQKAWLIDLKAGKINKRYTEKSDGLPPGELLRDLHLDKEGNILVVKDKKGKSIFTINTLSFKLTSL